MTSSHDVLLVGGGLVGAAAALGLARSGRSVVLVDRSRPKASAGRFGMDVRNIACSPASRALLEALGVWSSLHGAPYVRMCVWEERGTAALHFDAADAGRAELGWILENGPTVEALWQRLEAEAGVEIRIGTLDEIGVDADRVRVTVDGRSCTGRLLVGVDGARSAVRERVGVAVQTLATGQQALATVVRTEQAHQGVAYQRFLLDGPLALLPSAEPNLSSVVWSQSPDAAARRQALGDAPFCAELEAAIEARLGRIEATDERLTFPLQQHVVADFNPAPRVLLIGDAARVLHPLAGLGANVGFEDVRDLLAIVNRLPLAADLGAPGIWRAFARRRAVRARMMVTAMSVFRRGYAGSGPLETWVRNRAVDWVDHTPLVKSQIIQEALGLGPVATGL